MVDLPEVLSRWVETTIAGRLVSARPHFAGASREAWAVDVAGEDTALALFLLRDRGDGGGSARDAAVLRALAGTPVPVPRVVGEDPEAGVILMDRLPGGSDFPAIADPEEREATAGDLMRIAARLHALDVEALSVAHLEVPASPADCARVPLAAVGGALKTLGEAADPFFAFAHRWLAANVPEHVERIALVHSDLGPGNFLFEQGRVTGLVDWEVAHFGDPMEDLAALAVRDMATPVGSLARRLEEYAEASGDPVALARVHYYRALVLVRNALMIGLGLARPAEGFDVVEMTMYQTLLARAATLVLCDNLGVSRPAREEALPAPADAAIDADESRAVYFETLRRDLAREIRPAVESEAAARTAERLETALASEAWAARVGPALEMREREELTQLLGTAPPQAGAAPPQAGAAPSRVGTAPSRAGATHTTLEDRLRALARAEPRDGATQATLAAYFARRFHRLAERRRPLMGALADRLPQPLEDA